VDHARINFIEIDQMMADMNYGRALAITLVLLSVAASIGYLVVKDYRRAIYYLLAAAITATVSW